MLSVLRQSSRSGSRLESSPSAGGGLPLNCPYCGRLMVHLHSEDDWHFYDCEQCGPITPAARSWRAGTPGQTTVSPGCGEPDESGERASCIEQSGLTKCATVATLAIRLPTRLRVRWHP